MLKMIAGDWRIDSFKMALISFTSLFQSLSHCELITDDGILHLSNSTCGHERLQVLELDNCLLITDVTLEHLENCHNLERIELYDCQQVTRAGIKRIRVGAVWASSGGSTHTTDTSCDCGGSPVGVPGKGGQGNSI